MNKNNLNVTIILCSLCLLSGVAFASNTHTTKRGNTITKTVDTQTGEVTTTKTGPNGNTATTTTMGWENGKDDYTIQRTTEAGDYYHDTWEDVNKATGTTSRDYQEVGKYGGTDKTVVNNNNGTDTLYISNSSGQTSTNYSNEKLQNTKDTLKADRPSAGN